MQPPARVSTPSVAASTSGSAGAANISRRILRAATLVMALFFLSRVAGLAREMIISARFGTSADLDAYLAAFRVPDLLFQLIAGGALGLRSFPCVRGCARRRRPDRRGRFSAR